MALLRRVLYLQALVWGLGGLALALVPKLVLQSLLAQPDYVEHVWSRLFGVAAATVALLVVLVAHRIEELWWWCWAFVVMAAGVAGLFTLNAAFGLSEGANPAMWWVGAVVSWGLASGLLVGMTRASQESRVG